MRSALGNQQDQRAAIAVALGNDHAEPANRFGAAQQARGFKVRGKSGVGHAR